MVAALKATQPDLTMHSRGETADRSVYTRGHCLRCQAKASS
jgi:hypothetical protein